MSPARKTANLAASIRARLLNLSQQRKVEFQLVLSEFAIERLLYRLGASRHAGRFVLKGAMLFKIWSADRHRATWDLDLFGQGPNTVVDVVAAIQDLCAVAADDGIVFDPSSIKGEGIRAAGEYAGVRVRLEARLAEARIPVQVDVGFGDTITPAPVKERYPTLLGHPAPAIFVYPRETVVAEKLEAMISLGITNSRMKDFYDVQALASSFSFDGQALTRAIRATFQRRGTPFPLTVPLVLTHEFLGAPERQMQWRAFLRRGRLEGPPDAGELADALRKFLWPALSATARGEYFQGRWLPGGPWEVPT